MSDFNLIKTPEFLEEATKPAAQEIGKTLGNIFYAIFSPVNYNVEKLRLKQFENLKKYEQDIKNELSKIPEEQLLEPRLSIVGPALEASKYYIEEEEIREMFAKLIASSMNSNTINYVHHSFTEIIKQMNPLDAQVLNELALYESPTKTYPIAQFRFAKEKKTSYLGLSLGNSGFDLLKNAVWFENIESSFDELSTSIQNLNRLGIIDISYNSVMKNDSLYNPLTEGSLYQDVSNYCNTLSELPEYDGYSIKIQKGIIQSTSYGYSFSKVCFNNPNV